MKTITYNNLEQLINNKRIAIIGPADYVNNELTDKHGEYIDNFDIVIRLNSMIKYPIENPELEKYYGKKFDILASSFWYMSLGCDSIAVNTSRFIDLDQYKDISHSLILFENINRNLFNHIYNKNKLFFDKKDNFSYCNVPNFQHCNVIKYLNNIYHNPKTPTTGILAIANILLMNPKELYVSGITAYKDTKYNGYYDNYNLLSKEKTKTLFNNPNFRFDGKNYRPNAVFGHLINNEQKQLEYLIKNNIISVDKYLKSLFN